MKYIDNQLKANIIKLEDVNNNYTSENVEGALGEIHSKINNLNNKVDNIPTGSDGSLPDYGIITDGVTDNSEIIKNALTQTKYLILPSGKIYLESTVELESGTTITSLGDTEIITNGNPAFRCDGILNDSVTPNTVEFKHDIEISNLTFTFNSEAETSALRFNSVNDVTVSNCKATNISLITLSTSYTNSELISPDYDTVAAGGIVNEDCLSNNISICDNTIYCTNGNTKTVAIVVCYCKNVIISRNIIRNAADGVRIWGGNVGTGAYNRDEMEYYCKYITVSDNVIEDTVGGIWACRSAYVTFTGNSVNKCTDVGLDFEGCYSCTAVGNTVKDCINGCMGTMFSAKKISFVGNTCIDTGAMEQGVFLFAHTDNDNLKMDMYVADNTFTSKTRMLGSALLYSRQGSIIIENNIFNNASLGLGNTTYTRIKGNTFWVNPTLSQDFWIPAKAPVINITSIASEYNPEGVHRYNHEIIDNTFRNSLTTSINDATLENEAISITGSAWRQSMRILIKDNKMTGFPKDLVVNAGSGNANDESSIFLELIDNLFSGEIINESSNTFAKLYYEGNKKILTSTTGYVSNSLLSNFPNAIPTATGKATWLKGTKIYFDTPDASGNIGAICTDGGDPGTWKTFGGAGTVNGGGGSSGGSIDTSNFATKADLENKQNLLVSGTNIKTINGQSLLGNGNIEITSSGGSSGGSSSNISITVNDANYTATDSIITLPNYLTIPKDKKITIIGDSITYGYDGTDASLVAKPYPWIIQDLLGVPVYNYGISGSTISGGGDSTSIPGNTPMNIRYADMVYADYILVLGGVNDYIITSTPLGTKGDTTNQTFYGALKILIEGLIAKYPTGKIGFMTPLRKANDTAANGAGLTLKQYRDAIIDMCEDYCIPVLDLYTKGGCHPNIEAWKNANLPDGLHPNQAYYRRLALQIAQFIQTI